MKAGKKFLTRSLTYFSYRTAHLILPFIGNEGLCPITLILTRLPSCPQYLNSLCPFASALLQQQNAFDVFHSSHAADSLLGRHSAAERGETGRKEGEEASPGGEGRMEG